MSSDGIPYHDWRVKRNKNVPFDSTFQEDETDIRTPCRGLYFTSRPRAGEMVFCYKSGGRGRGRMIVHTNDEVQTVQIR
jgi:hypothetical protein